jgi:uncharacterized membrane protein
LHDVPDKTTVSGRFLFSVKISKKTMISAETSQSLETTSLHPQKKHPRLPYPLYFYPACFLIVIGLGSCLYLGIVHFRNYTDLGFASICALSKSINCDTVAQSPYSILLSLPVAIWGIFVFLLFGLLIINTRRQRNMGLWWLTFGLGIVCCTVSIFYGYVSAQKIHSYCIFCLICYICYFAITFLAFIVIRRFHISPNALIKTGVSSLRSCGNLLVLTTLLGSFTLFQWKLPHYWEFSPHPIPRTVATGQTITGAHWIGASNPKLTIEEYADYMCFQCGKMHIFLRNLVNEHPNDIRLIHHNYPMDHLFNPLVQQPFHVGAGLMALLAICAGNKDKFWEMNDELYRIFREGKQESIDVQALADRINLPKEEISQAFSDPEYLRLLNEDIRQGLLHRISSTPSYIIDGKVYTGTIPLEIFSNLRP